MVGALPEFIYKIADDGVYVDLFNESSITWKQGDDSLTLKMQTAFPAVLNNLAEVKLQLTLPKETQSKIRVRVPSWATKPVEFFVNGKKEATATPGTYVVLDRQWKDKDEIKFALPVELRLTKYAGDERNFQDAYAIEYGPFLMAVISEYARSGRGVIHFRLTAEEFLKSLKPVSGEPLHFSVDHPDSADVKIIPYFEVQGKLRDIFTCFPNLKK
jgi:DUF1680 family protein